MSEDAHCSDNWPEPAEPLPPEDPSWAPLDHLIDQIEQAYQECAAGPNAIRPWPSTATIPPDLALATLVFNSGDVVQAILRTPTQPTYHAEILDHRGAPRRAQLQFERFMHADLARPIYLEAAPQDC